MIYGTPYFASELDAWNYYRPYGYGNVRAAVSRKLAEGQIHIGSPEAKPGERVFLNVQEGRYFIETN